MKVYLLQSLVDNCAYVTERVCLTERAVERELKKFQMRNPEKTTKIEVEKVIE
ncbi:MAG: hypothetical protein M0R17_10955 [Candidatus Omnitrophica bacterium]|jgi:hypothetical protein|nr:hypothetical protein [Candidatus Omnitrophota bacterium]